MAFDMEDYCLRQMARSWWFVPESDPQQEAIDALVLRGLCRPQQVKFADAPKTFYQLTDAGRKAVTKR